MSKNREESVETQEINDRLASWMKDIQRVARKAEVDWPDVVEADDVVQDTCVKILEAPGTVQDLAAMDKDSRYQTLHKIAQRIASQKRDDDAVFSGNFRYSVGEVEKLVKQVGRYWNGTGESPFTVSGLASSWSVGDVISTGRGDHSDPTSNAALDGIEKASMRKDLLTAFEKLNPRYLDVIVRRHVNGERGFSEAEQKRIERALVELTHEMNHSYKRQHTGKLEPGNSLGDGPGTRRAISNSTARYFSKEGWDSDYMPAPSHLRDNHIEPEVRA
ncbi:MAG: hypothetical protein ACXWOV_02860 [Isosphaeraceae bacterium]